LGNPNYKECEVKADDVPWDSTPTRMEEAKVKQRGLVVPSVSCTGTMERVGANCPKFFGSLGSPIGESENSLDCTCEFLEKKLDGVFPRA
jgi:hypothetical protein